MENLTDDTKKKIKNWFKKGINTSYKNAYTILDYPEEVDGETLTRAIPLLFIFTKEALSKNLNWEEINNPQRKAEKNFIEKFNKVFPSSSKAEDYFDSVKSKLLKADIKVGDLKVIFQRLENLIKKAKSTDIYTTDKPVKYKEFFVACKKDPGLIKKCKEVMQAIERQPDGKIAEKIWSIVPSSSDSGLSSGPSNPPNSSGQLGSSAAQSKEKGPIISKDRYSSNDDIDDDEEEKKKEIKTKIENNIQPSESSSNAAYANIFKLNPFKLREKLREDRKYNFKEEFDEFEQAIEYTKQLEDIITQKEKEAPKIRQPKIEKARKLIKPAVDKITKYFGEAKKQYEATNKLDYITYNEASRLTTKIFDCMRKAHLELLELGRKIEASNIVTKREMLANTVNHFIRSAAEVKRDVFHGTRTARGIEDFLRQHSVGKTIKAIEKYFPAEEAEKMINDFKTAYYNKSPENDEKLDSIINKLKEVRSKAKDEKAKREITTPIRVLKKIKEKVFDTDHATDTDYVYDENGDRIYKNKTVFEKIKNNIKGNKVQNPKKDISFWEFWKKDNDEKYIQNLEKKWDEEPEKVRKQSEQEQEKKRQEEREADINKRVQEALAQKRRQEKREKEITDFKKAQEKEAKNKAKTEAKQKENAVVQELLKLRNERLDKEREEERQKNKEVLNKVLGKITGKDRVVDEKTVSELFNIIKNNEAEIERLKHPEWNRDELDKLEDRIKEIDNNINNIKEMFRGSSLPKSEKDSIKNYEREKKQVAEEMKKLKSPVIDKFRIKKLEDENRQLKKQLEKVRKGTSK